jgi:hypothetical protein
METGKWKLENEDRSALVPSSDLRNDTYMTGIGHYFPNSIFHFLVSSFQFQIASEP